jgi:hypothetical protein
MTVQDELEIRNLAAAYAVTTDNADVDGFMDCWVPVEDFGGYESGPFGSMKTWQELKDFESHHVGEGGMANGKRHQVTNVMVEFISANEAHVTHDLVVLETAEIPSIIATGRYDKSLVVKTDNGWKFKSRTLTVDSGFFKLMEQQKAKQSNS